MSTTLLKLIPRQQLSAYIDMGWEEFAKNTVPLYAEANDTFTSVTRQMHSTNSCMYTMPMHICEHKFVAGIIRRPMGLHDSSTLEAAISFQSWATKQDFSMRMLLSTILLCKTYKTHISLCAQGRTFLLRVYGAFDSDAQFNEYVGSLKPFFAEKTLSLPELKAGRTETNAQLPDFWWDVENHKLLSFDKNFMSRIDPLLKNTFRERHNISTFDYFM